jgi:hypothetical protein
MKRVIVLAALFASTAVLGAQQVVTFSTPGGEVMTNYVMLEASILKGAPYAAETVNDSIQVLADGNRITRHVTGRVYRDSDGRTRREEDATSPGGIGPDRPVVIGGPSISISDPVSGVSYTLDPVNHVAWKTLTGVRVKILQDALQAKVQASGQGESASGWKVEGPGEGAAGRIELRRSGANTSETHGTEKLGPQLIEGVTATGNRNTTTIAAGAVGNDQPITIVSEEWRSSDLGVLVLTSHKDPRSGESSYRLLNIVRGDPDPSLFQVPADYTIKESGVRRLEPTGQER